jgi:hypothetical protein
LVATVSRSSRIPSLKAPFRHASSSAASAFVQHSGQQKIRLQSEFSSRLQLWSRLIVARRARVSASRPTLRRHWVAAVEARTIRFLRLSPRVLRQPPLHQCSPK